MLFAERSAVIFFSERLPMRLLLAAAAAAAAALLAERAGAPCAAGWTPLVGPPERCYRLMRHSDGCPSMVTRSAEPFSDQKSCATDWAGCAAMCQGAAVGANSSAVIGSLRDPAAAELLFGLVEGLSDEEKDDRHVWIGYNALREGAWPAGGAGARWSWAADPARDATVAGSAPDIAFESQPWFAAELGGYEYCDEPVGGEACSGPCAGVEQVSDAARGSRRGGALAPPLCASARQCAHSGLCLCESSALASLRPELDTTEAAGCRTPDVSKCGGCASCRRGMSYPGDCCAPPGDAATCRVSRIPSFLCECRASETQRAACIWVGGVPTIGAACARRARRHRCRAGRGAGVLGREGRREGQLRVLRLEQQHVPHDARRARRRRRERRARLPHGRIL